MRRALRAFPALLRVGVMEAIAYRAEFIIWMLTTTMPLVMLALWSAVAAEGPFGRFQQTDFVAYYLGALIVRTLTSCWLVWEMNQEVRMGVLSMRLLRPIHPLYMYSAEHISAIPMRAAVALPIALLMLATTEGSRIVTDPVQILLLPLALVGAWLITFFTMAIIGSLSMIMQRSVTVWEVWFGLYAVLSGYLVPIELLPSWIGRVAAWLPFRYMLGFPVELLTGMTTRGAALEQLGVQWAIVAILGLGAVKMWNVGVRRFEAFGN